MRLIVLFDLPTTSTKDRKVAAQFRKQLISDGFVMLQYSVYSRICANHDIYQKHLKRVENQAPKDGSVRIIAVTEHQFTNMRVLAGIKTANERRLQAKQLTFF